MYIHGLHIKTNSHGALEVNQVKTIIVADSYMEITSKDYGFAYGVEIWRCTYGNIRDTYVKDGDRGISISEGGDFVLNNNAYTGTQPVIGNYSYGGCAVWIKDDWITGSSADYSTNYATVTP